MIVRSLALSLATLAALTACKAQRGGGAQVRELGDQPSPGGKDLGLELSEIAAAMQADLAIVASRDVPVPAPGANPGAATGFSLADEPVLSPDDLDALRAQLAASSAALRRAQDAVDRRDRVRAETIARLNGRLTAATTALNAIGPEDTERYRQGLADMRRVLDELAAVTAEQTVADVSAVVRAITIAAGNGSLVSPPPAPPTPPAPAAPAKPAAPPAPPAPPPAVDPQALAAIQGLWFKSCQPSTNIANVASAAFFDVLADGRVVQYNLNYQASNCTGAPYAVNRMFGKLSTLSVTADGVYSFDTSDRDFSLIPNTQVMVNHLNSTGGICGGTSFALGKPTRLTIAGCPYVSSSGFSFTIARAQDQRVFTVQQAGAQFARLGESTLVINLFPESYRIR